MGQQDRHVDINCRNFLSLEMDQQATTCTQEIFSRSENASCTLFSCSLQNNIVVGKSESLILEDNENNLPIFYVLPCPQEQYIIPIQQWIEECCRGTCYLGHECNILDDLHDDFLDFNLASIKILAYVYLLFDVSLFCFIAKHKGKTFDVNKE
jgi:hypothetical protein